MSDIFNDILRQHADAQARVSKDVAPEGDVYTNDHCTFAYCPDPDRCKPDGCVHPRPLTAKEQAMIDDAWERHKAANSPSTGDQS